MTTTSTKIEYVVEIRKSDVLCGHGLSNQGQDGNAIFRRAVADHARQYKDCGSTSSKKEIVRNITDSIRKMGGRFLKELPRENAKRLGAKNQIWYVLGSGQCIEEVEGALQDACVEEDQFDSSLQHSSTESATANADSPPLIPEGRAAGLQQDEFTEGTSQKEKGSIIIDVDTAPHHGILQKHAIGPLHPGTATAATTSIATTTATTTTERRVPRRKRRPKRKTSIPLGTGAVEASSVGMPGPKAAFMERKPAQSAAATTQTFQNSPIPFSPSAGRTVPKRLRVSLQAPNSRAAFRQERNVLRPLSSSREQKKTVRVDRVGGVGRRAAPVGLHMQGQFEDPEWPTARKASHKKRALPAAIDGVPPDSTGTSGAQAKQAIPTEAVPRERDSRKDPESQTKANPRQNGSLYAAMTGLASPPPQDTCHTNENAAGFSNLNGIDHARPEDLTTTTRGQHDHRAIPPRVVYTAYTQMPLVDPVLSCALPSIARMDLGNADELPTRQRKALVQDLPNNDDQLTTAPAAGALLPPPSPLVSPEVVTTHDKTFQSKHVSPTTGQEANKNERAERDSQRDKKDGKRRSYGLPHTMPQEADVEARPVAIAPLRQDEALETEEGGVSVRETERQQQNGKRGEPHSKTAPATQIEARHARNVPQATQPETERLQQSAKSQVPQSKTAPATQIEARHARNVPQAAQPETERQQQSAKSQVPQSRTKATRILVPRQGRTSQNAAPINGISSVMLFEDAKWRTEVMMVANKRERVQLVSGLLSYLPAEKENSKEDDEDYEFPRGAVGKGYVLVRIKRHSASRQSKSQTRESRDNVATLQQEGMDQSMQGGDE